MSAHSPQGRHYVEPINQDHPSAPDADNALPPEPRPTRIVRGEPQLLAQFADGAPAIIGALDRSLERLQAARHAATSENNS